MTSIAPVALFITNTMRFTCLVFGDRHVMDA